MVKVKTVMYRNDPIILGMPPGISGKSVPLSAANIWLAGKSGCHGRQRSLGVYHPLHYGDFHPAEIRRPCQARRHGDARFDLRAITGALSFSSMKTSILQHGDVLWALATRCDPATAINIINEAWSTPLDPRITPEARAARNFTNSVAIINACQPYHWRDQYAKTCYFPEEVQEDL